MNELFVAAVEYVNALNGPRKLEIDRLKKLCKTVQDYMDAHQGSSSESSLSSSSCSMRSASASQ